MNKRQIKKRKKIINERLQFFNKHFIIAGMRAGKTALQRKMFKACYGKKYKQFKSFKKVYNKKFLSVDLSNGKDYSVETRYKISKNIVSIINTKILN